MLLEVRETLSSPGPLHLQRPPFRAEGDVFVQGFLRFRDHRRGRKPVERVQEMQLVPRMELKRLVEASVGDFISKGSFRKRDGYCDLLFFSSKIN